MTNLSVGIVGLPNAGKSTLFNALLKKQKALSASYPFATIEPNIGIVPVPDIRLEHLKDIVKKDEGVSPPTVPTTIKFVDIAGLVKNASKGEGLGNKFLSHIREVDLICHVVRAFENPDVAHVAGKIKPEDDIEIVETELILSDLQTIENQRPPKKGASKEEIYKWNTIQKAHSVLSSQTLLRSYNFSPKEKQILLSLCLLTIKPVLYIINTSEQKNIMLPKKFSPQVHIYAKLEEELSSFSIKEQQEYLKSINMTSSCLDTVIQKAYKLLNLISFLTMGEKEVRAWTITRGTPAPSAGAVIHTDFEKKFIKARVISFDMLSSIGSLKKAKEEGKIREEGKEYIVQDGDVIEFMIGA